jgi:hypothetical protein
MELARFFLPALFGASHVLKRFFKPAFGLSFSFPFMASWSFRIFSASAVDAAAFLGFGALARSSVGFAAPR